MIPRLSGMIAGASLKRLQSNPDASVLTARMAVEARAQERACRLPVGHFLTKLS